MTGYPGKPSMTGEQGTPGLRKNSGTPCLPGSKTVPGVQVTPATMGLEMSGLGGGNFPTEIIDRPPEMPGGKVKFRRPGTDGKWAVNARNLRT